MGAQRTADRQCSGTLHISAILVNYLLYDVRPVGTKTMNALLFERFADDLGNPGRPLRFALTTVPLFAEAILLVQAAQTGFVDGPRILGALATDRLAPRRLSRLNSRLAPAPGILFISITAIVTTVLSRGALEPLVIPFVVAVFTTFTISQWRCRGTRCAVGDPVIEPGDSTPPFTVRRSPSAASFSVARSRRGRSRRS